MQNHLKNDKILALFRTLQSSKAYDSVVDIFQAQINKPHKRLCGYKVYLSVLHLGNSTDFG